jgi:hypothetical protein
LATALLAVFALLALFTLLARTGLLALFLLTALWALLVLVVRFTFAAPFVFLDAVVFRAIRFFLHDHIGRAAILHSQWASMQPCRDPRVYSVYGSPSRTM